MERRFVAGRVQDEYGVAKVLRALQDAGVPRKNVEVLSEVPLPERLLRGPMKATHLLRYTLAGLLGGMALGLFFSVVTTWIYPLDVGAQPSVGPPALVIIYEMTMLGIVVATFVGLVWEMRPWRDASKPYWPDVAEGGTYVVVELPPDFVPTRVQSLLVEGGAEPVDLEAAAA